jgi:nucleotide-binding universal stress UspA family protein
MPLLTQASQVILVTVMEGPHAPYYDLTHLARQLKWNGISAEPHILSDSTQPIAKQLVKETRELNADLLVIGGFGHSSIREQIFGGVTRELMDAAAVPVFLMH